MPSSSLSGIHFTSSAKLHKPLYQLHTQLFLLISSPYPPGHPMPTIFCDKGLKRILGSTLHQKHPMTPAILLAIRHSLDMSLSCLDLGLIHSGILLIFKQMKSNLFVPKNGISLGIISSSWFLVVVSIFSDQGLSNTKKESASFLCLVFLTLCFVQSLPSITSSPQYLLLLTLPSFAFLHLPAPLR